MWLFPFRVLCTGVVVCFPPWSSALVWLSPSRVLCIGVVVCFLQGHLHCVAFYFPLGSSVLMWLSAFSRVFCIGVVFYFLQDFPHLCGFFYSPSPGSLHGCAFLLSSRVIYTGVAFDFSSGSTTLVY